MATSLTGFLGRALTQLKMSPGTGFPRCLSTEPAKKPYKPSDEAKAKIKVAVKSLLYADQGRVPRPLTALQLYMRDQKLKGPPHPAGTIKQGENLRVRSQEFTVLPEGRKNKFIKEAKKELDRYLEEKKKHQLPEKQKRALSAYNFYVKERFHTRPVGMTPAQYIAALSLEFKNLNEQQLAKYVALHEADLERVRLYRDSLPPVPPKPKTRPPNAYNLFVQDKLAARQPGQSPRDVFEKLSGEWEKLDPDRKQKYHEEAGPPPPPHVRKRAMSPYNFYVQEGLVNRAEGERTPVAMKKLAIEWKTLSAADKIRYEDLAAKDLVTHPKSKKKSLDDDAADA